MDDRLQSLQRDVKANVTAGSLATLVERMCSAGQSVYEFLPEIVQYRDDSDVRAALQRHALLDSQQYGTWFIDDSWDSMSLLEKDGKVLMSGVLFAFHTLMHYGGLVHSARDSAVWLSDAMVNLEDKLLWYQMNDKDVNFAGYEFLEGLEEVSSRKGSQWVSKERASIVRALFGNLADLFEKEVGKIQLGYFLDSEDEREPGAPLGQPMYIEIPSCTEYRQRRMNVREPPYVRGPLYLGCDPQTDEHRKMFILGVSPNTHRLLMP